MSKNIEFYDYAKEVNRKHVQADLNAYVSYADRGEVCCGIPSIQWMDTIKPFDSYDDAKQYIETHYCYDYQQVAVQYKEKPQKLPAYYNQAVKRKQDAYERWRDLSCVNYLGTLTSEYVGWIDTAKLRIKKAAKELKDAERKVSAKGTVRWLVKIEYHT